MSHPIGFEPHQPLCARCGYHHTPARGWRFDGRGINSCDPWGHRLATATVAARQTDLDLMAAAPDLLRLLEAVLPVAADGVDARDRDGSANAAEGQDAIDAALDLINRLRGAK